MCPAPAYALNRCVGVDGMLLRHAPRGDLVIRAPERGPGERTRSGVTEDDLPQRSPRRSSALLEDPLGSLRVQAIKGDLGGFLPIRFIWTAKGKLAELPAQQLALKPAQRPEISERRHGTDQKACRCAHLFRLLQHQPATEAVPHQDLFPKLALARATSSR